MKIIFSGLLILLIATATFKAVGNSALKTADLTSTTFIEPNKSFVLGDGKHGDYRAEIVNRGKVEVEVFTEVENESRKSMGILKPGDKSQFSVDSNTKAIFKNLGAKTAVLGIVLSDGKGLSMGYRDNQN